MILASAAEIPRKQIHASPLPCVDARLILLFPSLLAIPLARQCFFDAALLAWFQVKGVTLDFLDNIFRLHLTLKPAQRVFKRLAFLHANLCQRDTPPTWPKAGLIHRLYSGREKRGDV